MTTVVAYALLSLSTALLRVCCCTKENPAARYVKMFQINIHDAKKNMRIVLCIPFEFILNSPIFAVFSNDDVLKIFSRNRAFFAKPANADLSQRLSVRGLKIAPNGTESCIDTVVVLTYCKVNGPLELGVVVFTSEQDFQNAVQSAAFE